MPLLKRDAHSNLSLIDVNVHKPNAWGQAQVAFSANDDPKKSLQILMMTVLFRSKSI